MERGLMWLPLLGMFIWLAAAGWHEFKKVEAYQLWAKDFERHKYDIYAVLGQKGDTLVWGKPTRKQPTELQTVNLPEIAEIKLKIDGVYFDSVQISAENKLLNPKKIAPKNIAIELFAKADDQTFSSIPFTDMAIAVNWYNYLLKTKG
jgi:hypothetical protein